MVDIRLHWDNAAFGRGDIAVADGDLETDDGLQTAVIVSLFTDTRVETDELPAGSADKRGWWGQTLQDDTDDAFGSKLWLLEREKRTLAVLPRFEEYCREALAWLIEDNLAVSVDVTARFGIRRSVAIGIEIRTPDARTREFQFAV